MSTQVGSGRIDELVGTDVAETIFGQGGGDDIQGGGGEDVIHGGGGDDRVDSGAGNDTVFGASSSAGNVDMDRFRVAEDTTATITFEGESAGYRNTLGLYRIDADGAIAGVEIVFANASLNGSGGNLIGGESAVSVDLAAGERLGFFVVPNAYSKGGMADLLTEEGASFKFVDADGNPANVNNGGPVSLVQTSAEGVETMVRSQYGTQVFHSITSLNGDNYDHVTGEVDVQAGSVRIGFEDLWNGGDKDFDDSVFTVDMGVTNAALLPRESSGASESDNDVITGGFGNDDLYGMRGDDDVSGGEGDDRVWGNSGNDLLEGNDGNDEVYGGSGDDILYGNAGNDRISGNTGADQIFGGEGDDVIEGNSGDDIIADGDGNDRSSGGSGNDRFVASSGDDFYKGGSGFDSLDYSWSRTAIDMDLSKHTVTGFGADEVWSVEQVIGTRGDDTMKGDKRDNDLQGGTGSDMIRGLGGADVLSGGGGNDRFVWYAKDVVDATSGEHLGVDTITDYAVGDRIELNGFLGGQSFADLSEVVRLTDGEQGATLSVSLGGEFVDVATLDGVAASDVSNDDLIVS